MHDSTSARHRGAPRWLLATASLAALLTLAPAQPGLRVTRVSGPVQLGSGEPPSWRAAQVGDALAPGDTVRTGAGGSAELVLGARTARLYESSVVRLPAEAPGGRGPLSVALERGRSLFDVPRAHDRDHFDVHTAEVVVSVKGTRFLVSAGEVVEVAVFRGAVAVRSRPETRDDEVTVRPGFSAFGGAGIPLELELTPFDDPWEAWVEGVEPVPTPHPALRERARRTALDAAKALAGEKLHEHRPQPPATAAPSGEPPDLPAASLAPETRPGASP